MITLKNKKDLLKFIRNQDKYIENFTPLLEEIHQTKNIR